MSNSITTHVLETSIGRPAAGVSVTLENWHADGSWKIAGSGVTDSDGRLQDLLPEGELVGGRYRICFGTGDYYAKRRTATFYPSVTVEFEVADAQEHYHVPLLLSPCGYSTYRGS